MVLSGPEFEKWKLVQLFDERYLEFQSWRLIKGNKGSGGWESCVAKSGDAFTERSRVIGRRTIERSGTEYTLSRCVGNSLEYHAVFNFYDPRVESGFHKEGWGMDFSRRAEKKKPVQGILPVILLTTSPVFALWSWIGWKSAGLHGTAVHNRQGAM